MKVQFRSHKMANIFNSDKELIREYGFECANDIIAVLKALRAAESLNDFWPPFKPPFRCHELNKGNSKNEYQISFDIQHPYRLIVIPDHNPVPLNSGNGLNWAEVTDIIILSVTNTHKKGK